MACEQTELPRRISSFRQPTFVLFLSDAAARDEALSKGNYSIATAALMLLMDCKSSRALPPLLPGQT